MEAIQLSFDIDTDQSQNFKMAFLQNQVDELYRSMGKVRRKLFSQMSELQKNINLLKTENEHLKSQIKDKRHEKTNWIYAQEDSLFDVQKYQASGY